ncbi:MAG: DinB family protein [Calditrichota bacterium]
MLTERIKQWEDASEAFLHAFQQLSIDQTTFKPSPEKWSAIQIAEHLHKVDGFALRAVTKAKSRSKLSKPGVINELLTRFACAYLRSPLKLKVPSEQIAPSNEVSIDEILSGWKFIQQELRKEALNMPPEKQEAAMFKHPIIGMINLDQTFRFLTEHTRNHHRQLQRLIVTLSEK